MHIAKNKEKFPRKIAGGEEFLPGRFLNIKKHLEVPGPLNPATKQPLKPEDFAPLFPQAFIRDNGITEDVEIPTPVLDVYAQYRPSPLFYAAGLKKALDTPAHIYYKYEGVSPTGSHKVNTAVVQAFYAKQEGVNRLTTETGAGQWGAAMAFAGSVFGLEIRVYMVKSSFEAKPGRRALIQSLGAEVHASPTTLTESGKKALEQTPDTPGTLGLAISEAIEEAVKRQDTKYALGSVLDGVLLHQTVIGQEAAKQMQAMGVYPDVVIGCVGGGSNYGGISLPFVADKLTGKKPETRFIAVEPAECPSLTKGEYRYELADTAGFTPLLKMMTLDPGFVPPPIPAEGMRYHGDAPIISKLVHDQVMEARAYSKDQVMEAGVLFTKTEGILPAPESAHAIKAGIDEALKAKQEGKEQVILINVSGHGFLDHTAYQEFLDKKG